MTNSDVPPFICKQNSMFRSYTDRWYGRDSYVFLCRDDVKRTPSSSSVHRFLAFLITISNRELIFILTRYTWSRSNISIPLQVVYYALRNILLANVAENYARNRDTTLRTPFKLSFDSVPRIRIVANGNSERDSNGRTILMLFYPTIWCWLDPIERYSYQGQLAARSMQEHAIRDLVTLLDAPCTRFGCITSRLTFVLFVVHMVYIYGIYMVYIW